MRILLCIDDTDTLETIGTGRLARTLAAHLHEKIGAQCLGITRHQLLLDPAIPYTSHNSSACMEIEFDGKTSEAAEEAGWFMRDHFHPGADPGMAILGRNEFSGELEEFGRYAQKCILTKTDAFDLAKAKGVHLEEFGGTGEGVIGALAGLGLRGGGNDGRFIELRGIRELGGIVSVEKIYSDSKIESVIDARTGKPLPESGLVDTRSWIRPDLLNGRIVLLVSPNGNNIYSVLKDKKNGAGKK